MTLFETAGMAHKWFSATGIHDVPASMRQSFRNVTDHTNGRQKELQRGGQLGDAL